MALHLEHRLLPLLAACLVEQELPLAQAGDCLAVKGPPLLDRHKIQVVSVSFNFCLLIYFCFVRILNSDVHEGERFSH